MLNTPLSSGISGLVTGTLPGVTLVPGTVPGEPISELLEPLKNNRAPASLSLVRLTSTKRISAWIWLGNSPSIDGSACAPARSAVARPRTKTMVWRGSLAQLVHRLRLVAPGPMALSSRALLPTACTSATFGSPTAARLMLTGRRSSCCRPWSISITAGTRGKAEQPPVAARASVTGSSTHSAASRV